MAATAEQHPPNKDLKQGRLPFKVLDIKTAVQRPNTPQLKRKRTGSDDGKSLKVLKSDNSNKTASIETITKDNACENASVVSDNDISDTVVENNAATLDNDRSVEIAKLGAGTETVEELETRQTVEDVLRKSVIEIIDKIPKSVSGRDICEGLNSSLNSSMLNSSVRSESSDLNESTPLDNSLEIVSEVSIAKKNKERKELSEKQVKRKEELARLRTEKERKLMEAKELKKKLAEEVRAKRSQEKQEIQRRRSQEKEEAKQKLLMKKEQEQREKEEKMQQKLLAKEKEKEEKQRLVDEKKLQLSLKLDEKRKKDEEKQKKLDEKKKLEEEEERKKKKVKAVFASFFIKNESSTQTHQEQSFGLFKPFEVKKDMMLASVIPASVSSCFNPMRLEGCLKSQDCQKLYIQELQGKSHKPYKTAAKTTKSSDTIEDVIILEDKKETTLPLGLKAKVFHFCENIRPLYWKTWRKKSRVVKPRNPFNKDSVLDYEVDSDEEWDEGGPGESLSGTEDEKESEDDYEVDNEFFVPHGYLSADEEKDEDSPDSPEMHQARLKMREREFQEDLKRKCSQLKPRILGCFWSRESNEELYKILAIYRAIVLSPLPIISSQSSHNGSSSLTSSPTCDTLKKRQSKCFPEDAMPHLIQLLHANKNNKQVLIKEFQEFWSSQNAQKTDSIERNADEDPNKENVAIESPTSPTISKGLIEVTIKRIATYTKNPKLKGRYWWVNEEIRSKYNVTDLPEVNKWQYQSFKEPQKANSPPTTPCGSIMKFARKITPTQIDRHLSCPSTPIEGTTDANTVNGFVSKTPTGNGTASKTPISNRSISKTPKEKGSVSKTPKEEGSVSKTPGKKRTMSILHFAKRLKTGENVSQPSTITCAIEDITIVKTVVQVAEENSVPHVPKNSCLNATTAADGSFYEVPEKESSSTLKEISRKNCSVEDTMIVESFAQKGIKDKGENSILSATPSADGSSGKIPEKESSSTKNCSVEDNTIVDSVVPDKGENSVLNATSADCSFGKIPEKESSSTKNFSVEDNTIVESVVQKGITEDKDENSVLNATPSADFSFGKIPEKESSSIKNCPVDDTTMVETVVQKGKAEDKGEISVLDATPSADGSFGEMTEKENSSTLKETSTKNCSMEVITIEDDAQNGIHVTQEKCENSVLNAISAADSSLGKMTEKGSTGTSDSTFEVNCSADGIVVPEVTSEEYPGTSAMETSVTANCSTEFVPSTSSYEIEKSTEVITI